MNKINKTMIDILSIVNVNKEKEYFLDKEDNIIDILKIKSKNLMSIGTDGVQYLNLSYEKLYKTYQNDIKIISLNFPTNTQEQQRYIVEKLTKTNNILFKNILQNKLNELIYIENNVLEREYYLFFYSKNIDEYNKNSNTINSILGSEDLIEKIDFKKKKQIIFKLHNMNSLILKGDEKD